MVFSMLGTRLKSKCEDDGVQDNIASCELECTTLIQFLNYDVMRINNQINIIKKTTAKVIRRQIAKDNCMGQGAGCIRERKI